MVLVRPFVLIFDGATIKPKFVGAEDTVSSVVVIAAT